MKKEEKTNKNSIERQKFQLHKKGYEGVTEAIKDLKEEKPEVQKMELMGAEIITIKGAKGDKGDSIKGDKGDSIKGDKGDKGDKGEDSTVKGPKGPKGDKGNDSIVPGPKGNDSKVKGPKGDKGNDGSPDSPKEIVSKLQGVKKKWLSIEAIDGDFNAKVRKQVLLNGASSSLKQLTDVDYSGLEQDSKGNYILGSGGVESVVAGTNVTVDDTDPQNPIVSASSGSSSPLTTKGDLYTYSTTDARLPVGADGEVIVADSSETTGIKWIANSGSDEKVKYDAADPTAGYVADKIIAGTGISVAEGTGASENKLVITNDSPETPVTVTDTAEIDLTLTGQDIQADIKTGSIDVLKLDSGVQDSLALADSALQSEVDTLQSVTDRGTISTNDLTFPKLIGGSTTTSDLTLQTTSGVGATGADMHFLTGNNGATEAMTILNSGNVGIGTTSPTIPLVVGSGGDPGSATIAAFINTNNGGAASIMIQNDVDNSAVETNEIISRAANRNNGKILFGRDADQSTADNADGFLALYTALNGNNVEAMRIDSDGNVGIGTTSPVEKLDVQTTGVFAAGINTAMQLSAFDTGSFSSGDGVGLLFKFVDRSAAPGYGKIAVIKQNHDTSSSMLFQTSLAGTLHTQMLIDNAGNVGIGTTNPLNKLDVVGSSGNTNLRIYDSSANSESALKLQNDAKTWYLQNWGSGGNALRILNNAGTTVMLWDDDGNVGIGTTSPEEKLHVNGSLQFMNDNFIKFDDNAGGPQSILTYDSSNQLILQQPKATNFHIKIWDGSGVTDALVISDVNKNVGIGTDSSPDYKLDVQGTFHADGESSFDGNVGIGTTGPTAVLHLKAGTATAGTAPFKLTSGVVNTTAEAGALEWDGTDLWISF